MENRAFAAAYCRQAFAVCVERHQRVSFLNLTTSITTSCPKSANAHYRLAFRKTIFLAHAHDLPPCLLFNLIKSCRAYGLSARRFAHAMDIFAVIIYFVVVALSVPSCTVKIFTFNNQCCRSSTLLSNTNAPIPPQTRQKKQQPPSTFKLQWRAACKVPRQTGFQSNSIWLLCVIGRIWIQSLSLTHFGIFSIQSNFKLCSLTQNAQFLAFACQSRVQFCALCAHTCGKVISYN